MTVDFTNAYEFRPEAKAADIEHLWVDGVRSIEVWDEGISDVRATVSLARLKRAKLAGGGAVLLPDDEKHLQKILWATRDLGPNIRDGRLRAGSIVHASVEGKKHIFLRAPAPADKSTELIWRVNTGMWGDENEILRLQLLLRGGDPNAAPVPLFHGCYALEGVGDEEVVFAEHAAGRSAHGYLVSKDLAIGRWHDVVLWNGQKYRVAYRRTYVWRNFDGFKLGVIGCIPDSGFLLINDKGKRRAERPASQRKFRDQMEERAWHDKTKKEDVAARPAA